jgi:integral membrane protein
VTSGRGTAAGAGAALLRYRILAIAVGIGLLVLVFVGIPLQAWADRPQVVEVVGPVHGFLYIAYLVAAADLIRRRRWPIAQLVAVVVAGLVPFAAFVVERRVTRRAAERPATP